MKSILTLATLAVVLAANQAPHGPAVTVIRVPNGGVQPQAALDASGILHLLYYSGEAAGGDLYYVRSPDEGRSWSAPLRVNSVPGSAIAAGTIRGGEMAIAKDGQVYVAWNGSSKALPKGPLNPESGNAGEPMLFTRLNPTRSSFEPQRNLMTHTFGLDGGGTVAADRAGHVYVAWHGKSVGAAQGEAGRQVWIAKSDDDGKTFAPEHTAWSEPTGACACCGMAIFADQQGRVRLLYRSATDSVHRDIYLLTSSNSARNFDGRKLAEWNLSACPMTSMSFAEGAGKEEAAWETRGQVFFENISQTTAAPVSAPAEGKNRKHPRLAISARGETLMAWTEGTGWGRGGSLVWQIYDGQGKPAGGMCRRDDLPAWSFGAVVAAPRGFLLIY